jgi:hypothetical protein
MRRCTVYHNACVHTPANISYEGWLVQILNDSYAVRAVVANEDGTLRTHDVDRVRLHVPARLDLISGAPRRAIGTHGVGLPADEN